ncbi:MAG: hypothetical protein ACRDBO_15795 [Lachnospiraceae bacterium]
MAKGHCAQRAEDLRVLIATAKVKHKLTNAKLAKEINIPLGTFNYWLANIEKFPSGKVWLIESLAEK